MSKNNEISTIEVPLLTLRGVSILPHCNVHIIAARESSIETINTAFFNGPGNIVVVTQMYDEDDRPDIDRVYTYGTLTQILSNEQSVSDTSYKCLLKGLKRIKLLEIIDKGIVRYAKAQIIESIRYPKEQEDKYLSLLKASFANAMKNEYASVINILNNKTPPDFIKALENEKDLDILVDCLSQVLNLSKDEKRLIAQTADVIQRAKNLITFINNFSYENEVKQKAINDAKSSIEKNQKEYFLMEQMKAIKRELNINDNNENENNELKSRLLSLKAPASVKDKIEKEIKRISSMPPSSPETAMLRNYIDTLLTIPWKNEGKVNDDLNKAKEVLDQEHYGLEKIKERILEHLSVQTRKKNLNGPILCLVGPPGIGKTSLGASIAKATNRKYIRMALGGVHDESEIRGHRRTYIGSMPGRIIKSMIKAGVNNPLFLLDEIDKVSSGHGDPESALLEVLDPEQNKSFSDNYVEIEYDLSKVMFIATANSYNISQPLLDRMEIIDLSSYTEQEKFNIAKNHLIKKQMAENTLTDKDFELKDDALYELIRYYTHEAGVRSLERLIGKICRKVVKAIAFDSSNKKKTTVKGKKRIINVKELYELLGPRKYDFTSKLSDNKIGLVNGLAWTSIGGDILQIEAVANKGTGKHMLTGKLGEVMKESISAAITVVRSLAQNISLNPSFYEQCDLHIHVPEGATPKEGPSAGIAMVTAIVSALTNNPVKADVAMTGEITLRGDVLPIGGLKEKLLAALRGGIKTAIIPADNEKDLWDIPDNVKKNLNIVPVKHIDQVLDIALENNPKSFKVSSIWKKAVASKRASKTKKV